MAKAILKLRKEHRNLSRVLTLIEGQLKAIRRHNSVDLVLLTNALHYMTRYPDRVHHRREDLIFERLVKRFPEAKEKISLLLEQHRQIYRLASEIAVLVESIEDGAGFAEEELLRLGDAYVTAQREHMSIEEKEVFPLAESLLKARDWKAVDAEAVHLDDPLFGERTAERYNALYNYLLQEHDWAMRDSRGAPNHSQ